MGSTKQIDLKAEVWPTVWVLYPTKQVTLRRFSECKMWSDRFSAHLHVSIGTLHLSAISGISTPIEVSQCHL